MSVGRTYVAADVYIFQWYESGDLYVLFLFWLQLVQTACCELLTGYWSHYIFPNYELTKKTCLFSSTMG